MKNSRTQFRDAMIGRMFAHLTVVAFHSSIKGNYYYLCSCDCGGERICKGAYLRANTVTRCLDCQDKAKETRKNFWKYKDSNKFGHPIWGDWNAMRRSCLDKDYPAYKYYGALGATMCLEWYSFADFCKDMGNDKPFNTILSRIDYTKPFCKENCRWVLETESEKYAKRNERARLQYHARKKRKSEPKYDIEHMEIDDE